jgi:hypothetical protein
MEQDTAKLEELKHTSVLFVSGGYVCNVFMCQKYSFVAWKSLQTIQFGL